MAYTPPPQWQHGDIPSAAQLNVYGNDLIEIATMLGLVRRDYCAREWSAATKFVVFVHQYRMLRYKGAGDITSMDESEKVAIDSKGAVALYDLDSVDWLAYGMLFRVSMTGAGMIFCVEEDA